jgi:hypothetical protein
LLWLGFRNRHEGVVMNIGVRVCVLFVLASPVSAFALDLVGASVGQAVNATLVRRGFLSTDPRVLQTLTSMGVRTAATGTGVTWAAAAGRLVPWVTTGVAVYSGVKWWFDIQGKAYLAPPGSTTTAPVFSSGVKPGGQVYYLSNQANVLAGSLQEAYAYMTSNMRAQYPDASYGVPTITQTTPTTWSVQYNYSIPSMYLNNKSGSVTGYVQTFNGTVTCASGTVFISGTGKCADAGMNSSPYAGAPIVGYDLETAYQNLPQSAKDALMSPELLAELSNRFWKDASSQPDYKGLPFDANNPITPNDATTAQNSNPQVWPHTSDIIKPVPVAASDAIPNVQPNPNQTNPGAGGTVVDLGPDPGNPAPTLEQTPTNIFKPISDSLQPFVSWTPPSHNGVCPTWSAAPSIAGHVFNIDLSSHCAIAEQYRSTIFAAALACWIVIAIFIILSA